MKKVHNRLIPNGILKLKIQQDVRKHDFYCELLYLLWLDFSFNLVKLLE